VDQRSKTPARVLAALALVVAFVVLVAVLGSLGEDDDSNGKRPAGQVTRQASNGKVVSAYVVQNGDTLTSIAHKTGVPLRQIEELNPGLDPQILPSGEKLKLR